MSKAKAAGEQTATSTEYTLENGAAALKSGLEKAKQNYDAVLGFGKDTAEACVQSATVAGKGIESLNSALFSYSRQSVEDTVTAAKAVIGAKSVHEAFALQTDFAKAAFESYVGGLSSVGEIVAASARDSYAPLKGRAQAWLDVVQTAHTA